MRFPFFEREGVVFRISPKKFRDRRWFRKSVGALSSPKIMNFRDRRGDESSVGDAQQPKPNPFLNPHPPPSRPPLSEFYLSHPAAAAAGIHRSIPGSGSRLKKQWKCNSIPTVSMETMHKNDALKHDLHEDGVQCKGGLTADLMAPWDPYFLKPPAQSNLDKKSHLKLVIEWVNKKSALLRTYGTTAIMFPDITPKVVNYNFHVTMVALLPILEKDSPRRFLRFFKKYGGWIVWREMIIPEALNCLVTENAVKCAKLVLEGTAPELKGHRANPNWMNQYGHFPLHQAAEIFAVDMIKLLISKGASANVRTACDRAVKGLLPLHVAVENTCLHKYLEDNQLPNQEPSSYSKADVYKLIHLLCLPEMKIFLDTTRELAKHTNDLVDEVWNYIKGGKLVQAGVLLLAAQEHIRSGPSCKENGSGPSCKENGNSSPDGFATIVSRIANHFYTIDLEMDPKEKELEQPHPNIKYLSSALVLVNAMSQAGKTLHEYILGHSEVPHIDVIERVSSILKDSGFYPPEEGTDIGNLLLKLSLWTWSSCSYAKVHQLTCAWLVKLRAYSHYMLQLRTLACTNTWRIICCLTRSIQVIVKQMFTS